MRQVPRSVSRAAATFAAAMMMVATPLQAKEWQVAVGAESSGRGSQALAFLPAELWIQTGDSIRWTFPTHERHTLTFLTPGQTRPPAYGPVFDVPVGCPGLTPDGSSFDGSACVTTGILRLDENVNSAANAASYSITFPATGNFKFVCLVHADMTGVVHVVGAGTALPHDQDFYATQAQSAQTRLLAEAASLAVQAAPGRQGAVPSNTVAAGAGEIITLTGMGSQTASLMRFLRDTIVVQVGTTVEWTNLDPSINHTVTFGTEPTDPRPPSTNVQTTSDGARQAVISSTADNVNSGVMSPTVQDRANLAQSAIGPTRFRVTFTSPGTYHYICAIHDDLGMLGTVIVF